MLHLDGREPLAVVLGLFACLAYLVHCWKAKHDPREPPLVPSTIPVIGHALGLLRHGIAYYSQQSAKHELPAFCLDLLVSKIYIITSPTLVSAVQRNHRNLSFEPLLTGAANRLGGIQGDGLDLLREKHNGGQGLNYTIMHAMHPALLGPGLDKMNERMIQYLQKSVDELANNNDPFDLYAWCRHAITVASTDAVYGRLNPYKHREIEDAFWDLESDITLLMVNVAPWLTARKQWSARETMVASFLKYYQAKGHENSSELAYIRWKTQHDAGATVEDIARLEVAAGFGILSNTVPTTFWMLFDLFSRPGLLKDIREELRQNALHVDASGTHTVDLADIRDGCPLLVSTFQEVLRLRSTGAPTRIVHQDIMLNDEYLLKKGAIVQMPAAVLNRLDSAWGDQPFEFHARRFMRNEDAKDSRRANGFVSFGVSPNICPGRHFSSGEIVALTAMLALRFDIKPAERWMPPRVNPKAMAASVPPPKEAFHVKVTEREEYAGVKWAFRVTEGKGKFGLIIG